MKLGVVRFGYWDFESEILGIWGVYAMRSACLR
jgi:hypothetical protein